MSVSAEKHLRLTHSTAFAASQRSTKKAVKQAMTGGPREFPPDSAELQGIMDHCFENQLQFALHWNPAAHQFRVAVTPRSQRTFTLDWKEESHNGEPTMLVATIGGFTIVLSRREHHSHKYWSMSAVEASHAITLSSIDEEGAKSEAIQVVEERLEKYVMQLRKLS